MEFDKEKFKDIILARLRQQYVKDLAVANRHDLYDAVVADCMNVVMDRWIATFHTYEKKCSRRLYYFSAEFLMGRALDNNLINLGIRDFVKNLLTELHIDLDTVEDEEPDPGLGNGHIVLILAGLGASHYDRD